MNNNYGKTIKKIRKIKNISQINIAGNHTSRSLIAKIENGEVNPSTEKLLSIMEKLDVGTDEFLFISNNYQYSRAVI